MASHMFTTDTLHRLGVFDEFYSLYMQVEQVYNSLERPDAFEQMRRLIMPILATALKKYTHLFTMEFSTLYVNQGILRACPLIHIKKIPEQRVRCWNLCSFREFLNLFFEMVAISITRRKNRAAFTVHREQVYDQIDSHIKLLIANRPARFVPMAYMKPTLDTSWIIESVLVFKNLKGISCNQQNHNVVKKDVSIPLSDMSGYVTLPVHQCLDCQRIFIGYQTLKLYEQEYGILQLQRRPDASATHDGSFAYMNESQLYQTGYNVIDGGFTQKERQQHLLSLMQSQRMTQFEIIRDLEHAIRLFEGRNSHRLAVTKWKADLRFVLEVDSA